MADDRRSGVLEVMKGRWSRCLEIRDSRDDGLELPTSLMGLEGLTVFERGIPATGAGSILSNGRSGCALQASLTGSRDLETWSSFNDDTMAVKSLLYR